MDNIEMEKYVGEIKLIESKIISKLKFLEMVNYAIALEIDLPNLKKVRNQLTTKQRKIIINGPLRKEVSIWIPNSPDKLGLINFYSEILKDKHESLLKRVSDSLITISNLMNKITQLEMYFIKEQFFPNDLRNMSEFLNNHDDQLSSRDSGNSGLDISLFQKPKNKSKKKGGSRNDFNL